MATDNHTTDTKEIPLTQGQVAIIDTADYELINQYKWFAWFSGSRFYARTNLLKSHELPMCSSYMHRLIMNASTGEMIDHIDGNGLNNSRGNLRLASNQENARNQKPRRGLSQFKGVTWNRQLIKWQAQIMVSGKNIYLGLFVDETAAARAYDTAAHEYFGEFACCNFEVQK